MKASFESYLKQENLSRNTIESYLWTMKYFEMSYDSITQENLLAYKGYLMEFFKPKTVNLRIQAINKYLDYLGKDKLRLKAVKIQQKSFLENVISNSDYRFLKSSLKKDCNLTWYFVVWFLAATGARVSEWFRLKRSMYRRGILTCIRKAGNSEESIFRSACRKRRFGGLKSKAFLWAIYSRTATTDSASAHAAYPAT